MDIEIKIGTVCNNRCIFCLNESRVINRTYEDIVEKIDNSVKKGVEVISFTGGEICIRPDFIALLNHAHKNCALIIHSNGRALSYDWLVNKIANYKPYFLISLHAHDKKLYQTLCGVDGYDQTIRGINNLKKYGLRFTINVVINNRNIKHLPEIVRHHSKLGAQLIQLSWIRPHGKGKSPELIPKFKENINHIKESADFLIYSQIPFVIINIPYCILPEYNEYKKNPYTNQIVISSRDNIQQASKIDSGRKKYVNKCKRCSMKDRCDGVYAEYSENILS